MINSTQSSNLSNLWYISLACIIQKWKLSDLITFLVEGATQGVTYRSGVDITFGQVKTRLGNNILYYS